MTQTPASPLYVANMAQNMARNANGHDGLVFQKVALVSMCVMAAASVVTVLQPLLRELNRKYEPPRGNSR